MSSAASLSKLLDRYDVDIACISEHKLKENCVSFLDSIHTKYRSHIVCEEVSDNHRVGRGGKHLNEVVKLQFSTCPWFKPDKDFRIISNAKEMKGQTLKEACSTPFSPLCASYEDKYTKDRLRLTIIIRAFLHLHQYLDGKAWVWGEFRGFYEKTITDDRPNKWDLLNERDTRRSQRYSKGIIHSGIGEAQLNSLLGCLNIPPVSHTLLDRRVKESGRALEEVAKESVEKSIQEEVLLQGSTQIDVCADAGWQKRGSGRSYDSLSGHCTMIGTQTGKVLGFSVRSKDCKTCQASDNPPYHDCRKNWDGSAKAMESDMVAEMVTNTMKKGVTIKSITGDDDSSTIATLRSKVDKNIIKKSDKNHVRKSLTGALYTLQKQHSSLTPKVISSIQRNFTYMLAQNKGNQHGIITGLEAQTKHVFGDHTLCEKSWCQMVKNQHAKHRSLPFGRCMNNPALKCALENLFSSYMKHSEKLACLGSTQANESMNMLIASKAPKSHHYAGSASLHFRVSSGVAQKNIGHQYIIEVNKKLGISPGTHTRRLFVQRDLQNKKRRAVAVTVAAKRHRNKMKVERNTRRSRNELHEGPSYHNNLSLELTDVPDTIPEAKYKPAVEPLKTFPRTMIFFDLETTGLGRDEHIIQIAAQRDKDTFNTYILPKKQLSKGASDVTHIDIVGNQMFYKNCAVDSLCISEAIEKFIAYIGETSYNVLIGHNCLSFDCPVLTNTLHSCDLFTTFAEHVSGFVDTRKVFKSYKPCTQQALAKQILDEEYNAHNALDDVIILKKIVDVSALSCEQITQASFSIKYCDNMYHYSKEVTKNLKSLQCLVESKIVSKDMAKRIAGSGLQLKHLVLALKRNGPSGIEQLFNEMSKHNQVRVTKSHKIIDSVVQFLSKQ